MTHRLPFAAANSIPDPIRLARYERDPGHGPRPLFLSGGSAMGPTCRVLKRYTHNSIHLITPFDSGGSSATLREAFGMVSVGDVRNRLLALADESVAGGPELCALFARRLEGDATPAALRGTLDAMVVGTHPSMVSLAPSVRDALCRHLAGFRARMPEGFDLRGASIGNLVLAGAFVGFGRDLAAAIHDVAQLLRAQGLVRPVTEAALHLRAGLADGSHVIGQHRITGKSEPRLASPIRSLSLVDPAGRQIAGDGCLASPAAIELIGAADMVCYPLGSFWTSVMANLLPKGIGRAIRSSRAPKVLLANAGDDPEMLGMRIHDCVDVLQRFIAADVGEEVPVRDVVGCVVVDARTADYRGRLDLDALGRRGVEIVDVPLVRTVGQPTLDPVPLAEVLMSFG